MVAIPPEQSTEDDRERNERIDPLVRIIHATLAIYLTPVVLIVCAIGGVSILYDKAIRASSRLATPPSKGVNPAHFSTPRVGQVGMRSPIGRDRRRSRVER